MSRRRMSIGLLPFVSKRGDRWGNTLYNLMIWYEEAFVKMGGTEWCGRRGVCGGLEWKCRGGRV